MMNDVSLPAEVASATKVVPLRARRRQHAAAPISALDAMVGEMIQSALDYGVCVANAAWRPERIRDAEGHWTYLDRGMLVACEPGQESAHIDEVLAKARDFLTGWCGYFSESFSDEARLYTLAFTRAFWEVCAWKAYLATQHGGRLLELGQKQAKDKIVPGHTVKLRGKTRTLSTTCDRKRCRRKAQRGALGPCAHIRTIQDECGPYWFSISR